MRPLLLRAETRSPLAGVLVEQPSPCSLRQPALNFWQQAGAMPSRVCFTVKLANVHLLISLVAAPLQ
jgi:hypothetical protein